MSTGCDQCALPIDGRPRRQTVDGQERRFCCYGCALAYQVGQGHHEESAAAWLLVRLGLGGFLAMNIMLFSLLLYSGGAEGPLRHGVELLLAALATPVLVFLGGPFARSAAADLRQGRVTGDTLITLGAGAAFGYSLYAVAAGGGRVYFDTATMVLVLFTVGRYIEAAGRARTARDLAPMLAAERGRARRLEADGEREVPVAEIAAGDRVRVGPGERVPVDGRVRRGTSSCDESVLTGQPEPQAKTPGSDVHAGSRNGDGVLEVEAAAAGADSRWVRVGRLVREGLARKGRMAERLDRIAAVFVPAVLALAGASFLYWNAHGPAEPALMAALSVLVVACPCALGLAVPLATALGVGAAARDGTLVRGGAVLERMAGLRGVALDKTGTVTVGAPRLTRVAARGDESAVLARAAALAGAGGHPLGRAVRAAAAQRPVTVPAAEGLQVYPGEGVVARVAGTETAVGSARLMDRLGWPRPEDLRVEAADTPVYVGWDGTVRGILGFRDTPLPAAQEGVASLHAAGLRTLMLSGDGPVPTETVARWLGVGAWRAGLMPEEKARQLQAWQSVHGPAAMVGDGLNDGPVLAAASVGVAVGGASDLARESADVVLPAAGWDRLPALLALARRVRRVVYGNLAWALGYNLVALSLAAAGLLLPVVAAALMAGSSLLVVAHSQRAGRPAAAGVRPAGASAPRAAAARATGGGRPA